ncbi:hypothetical protein D9756_007817 [Leucocoprinus leucothites]|uniref:Vacuolar protein-sorting-associated protein 36 n=1 Tax=Leucocoprinus leucothites TaxID=201217 RepID=A0A8H5D4V4_9AGAR|nr:hypothetical protein D9756_007817 [Leucoagaricus leucothites]
MIHEISLVMALSRYTVSIDGTIPVQALLYTDEQLLATQEGVGIYDGPQKSAPHQSGTVYITSHRLFYIDNKDPEYTSFTLDLAYITQTDYYAGLFTSSPKVTLYLARKGLNSTTPLSTSSLAIPGASSGLSLDTWECDVCGNKNRNPPGQSPSSTQVCELCGVPPSTTPQPPSVQHLSTSLPSGSAIPSGSSTRSRRASSVACPACTFLNHPSLIECEICGTKLSDALPDESQSLAKSAPATRPTSPDIDDEDDSPVGRKMMKVSFRKGGDKVFYTVLKRSLKSKVWESRTTEPYKSNIPTNSETKNSAITRSGITGILRSVETSAQGQDTDLKNALQDLEALMIKARDMVRLAGELNEKLTSSTTAPSSTFPSRSSTPTPSSSSSLALTSTNNESHSQSVLHELPEEATFIRSSLAQLGLQMTNIPVTNDMITDEDKWINELAKELSEVLRGMMRDRGIVALDEVWGGWNRARGVALLPPATFLQVIPLLPQYTSPQIHRRTFKSGLSVLHTPPYAQQAFVTRLREHIETEGPKTTMEIAMVEEITVSLAKEMIDDAEMSGDVVRDDAECVIQDDSSANGASFGGGLGVGEAGVRWWPNVFIGYAWDGQTFDD